MGFSKADFGEQVKYKAVNYYYAGYNDCDFELEITDVEVSPIYYSLAQKWISGNRLKSSIAYRAESVDKNNVTDVLMVQKETGT